MKTIINCIETKLRKIEELLESNDTNIDLLISDNKIFYNCLDNPDEIDFDFLSYFFGENVENLLYVEKFIGWFSKCPNESQVIKAREILSNIVKPRIEKNNKNILFGMKLKKFNLKQQVEYNILLEKLNSYSSKTYITNEDLSLINRALTDESITDELLMEYAKLGSNNANIKFFENFEDTNDNLNEIEQYEEIFAEIKEDNEKNYKQKECIEKYIEKLLKFKETLETKNKKYVFKQQILEIINIILKFKEITIDEMEEATLFAKEIETINDYKTYIIALSIQLLDLYNLNNKAQMGILLSKYQNSDFYNQKDLFDEDELSKKRKTFEIYLEKYFNEAEYKEYFTITNGMSKEEKINFYSLEKILKMELMEILKEYKQKYKQMNVLQISELLNKITTKENEYLDKVKENLSEKEQETTEELVGLDVEDVNNYIVFLSKDKIMENIERIVLEHKVSYSGFVSALQKLLMIPHEKLNERSTCKPILIGLHRDNQYGIREERGSSVRVCFKKISTIEGKAIYEVISFAYGSCGDREKHEELNLSVKLYEDNYEEYKKLEQSVKEGNISLISSKIDEGLTLYNEICELDTKKKDGESLC